MEAMNEEASITGEPLFARRYRALEPVWPSEALSRFFLLSQADLVQVRSCRDAIASVPTGPCKARCQ